MQQSTVPPASWTEACVIVWSTPSRHAGESMPVGGGDVGLNVWVENGELLFYIARSGCFDELGRMPKLGRVRVAIDPSPFADSTGAKAFFRQSLQLVRGCVLIEARSAHCGATIEVWVDAHRPVVHVEATTDRPTKLAVAYENWRLTERPFEKAEHHAARSWAGAPVTGVVRPDVVEFDSDAVTFFHRNTGETVFDLLVRQQGLEPVKAELWNPLADLTFGGRVSGDNLAPDGTADGRYASTPFRAWRLRSRTPANRHYARVVLHTAQAQSIDAWRTGLREIESAAAADDQARARTENWWREFWQRSWIAIDHVKGDASSKPWQAGRNAQLFRFQLGCNAKGEYPTKFNGGLFTFDPEYVDPNKPLDPDFRAWGGTSFTAQNQRLVYWPLLASGDGDLMTAQLDFYRRALGNAQARSRAYWNIDAACFVEQIELFGLCVGYEYGWKRKPDTPAGVEDSAWVCYQWDTVFEFCQMALDRYRYFGDDVSPHLPLIESCLAFYDAFYQMQSIQRTGRPLDDDDKLVIFPGTACETYKDALNPTPTICALRAIIGSLVELPDELLPAARKQRWRDLYATLPEMAMRVMGGRRVFAPAQSWARKQNCELPQLYSVYPWGEHGLFRSQLHTAIATWRYGFDAPDQKQTKSWHQDPIFCARLGLTREAADGMLAKLADAPQRFPTFWGPGHDWTPDHNQGGSGLIALQEMLMQEVSGLIYLFPAWPIEWDVHFKLHAPNQTTVEAELVDGVLMKLIVTPEGRRKDVIIALRQPEENRSTSSGNVAGL